MCYPAIPAIELDSLDAEAQQHLLSVIMSAPARTEPLVIVSSAQGECFIVMPLDWSEERQLAWIARRRLVLEAISGAPWQTLERV